VPEDAVGVRKFLSADRRIPVRIPVPVKSDHYPRRKAHHAPEQRPKKTGIPPEQVLQQAKNPFAGIDEPLGCWGVDVISHLAELLFSF